ADAHSNPKSEARNPKQTQMMKYRDPKPVRRRLWVIRILVFRFVSDFGFRVSDFPWDVLPLAPDYGACPRPMQRYDGANLLSGGPAMPALPIARPEEIGFLPDRLRRAGELLKHWADTDKIPSAALCVGRKGRMVEPVFVGRQRPGHEAPLRKD